MMREERDEAIYQLEQSIHNARVAGHRYKHFELAIEALKAEPCDEQSVYERAYVADYDNGYSDGEFFATHKSIEDCEDEELDFVQPKKKIPATLIIGEPCGDCVSREALTDLKYDIYKELCKEIHKNEECPCTNQTTSCLATFRVCDADGAIGRTIDRYIRELPRVAPERPKGDFTRQELENWLYSICLNNVGTDFCKDTEEIISRLDGFEQYVKDMRGSEQING